MGGPGAAHFMTSLCIICCYQKTLSPKGITSSPFETYAESIDEAAIVKRLIRVILIIEEKLVFDGCKNEGGVIHERLQADFGTSYENSCYLSGPWGNSDTV